MTVVSMVSIPVWVLGVRRDDRLASTGTPVLAEVVGVNDTDLTVRYTPPGAAAPVEASTHGSTDRVIGRRYPAHADSSGRLRLDADPYNWVGLGIWVLAGWGLVAMLVWPRLRWWRDARRFAANGPWYAAVVVARAGRRLRRAARHRRRVHGARDGGPVVHARAGAVQRCRFARAGRRVRRHRTVGGSRAGGSVADIDALTVTPAGD